MPTLTQSLAAETGSRSLHQALQPYDLASLAVFVTSVN